MQRHNFTAVTQKYQNEAAIWKQLLHRFLQVILLPGQRGLAFRGESERINNKNNLCTRYTRQVMAYKCTNILPNTKMGSICKR